MKKAQAGTSIKIKVKPLPKAGKQTPADFLPESYDKLPRTKSGGANYNGPKAGPREMNPKGMSKNGSMIKKAKDGGAFGMLSVKAGIDKNPNPTAADRIAGAKKMAKKGASIKKCKYGCK